MIRCYCRIVATFLAGNIQVGFFRKTYQNWTCIFDHGQKTLDGLPSERVRCNGFSRNAASILKPSYCGANYLHACCQKGFTRLIMTKNFVTSAAGKNKLE